MDDELKARLANQIKQGAPARARRQALRVTLMNKLGDPAYPAWSIIWYMPRGKGDGKGSGHRPYGPRRTMNWFSDIDQAIQTAEEYIRTRPGLAGCALEVEHAVAPAAPTPPDLDPLA